MSLVEVKLGIFHGLVSFFRFASQNVRNITRQVLDILKLLTFFFIQTAVRRFLPQNFNFRLLFNNF